MILENSMCFLLKIIDKINGTIIILLLPTKVQSHFLKSAIACPKSEEKVRQEIINNLENKNFSWSSANDNTQLGPFPRITNDSGSNTEETSGN